MLPTIPRQVCSTGKSYEIIITANDYASISEVNISVTNGSLSSTDSFEADVHNQQTVNVVKTRAEPLEIKIKETSSNLTELNYKGLLMHRELLPLWHI